MPLAAKEWRGSPMPHQVVAMSPYNLVQAGHRWIPVALHTHCEGPNQNNGGRANLLANYSKFGFGAVAITNHHYFSMDDPNNATVCMIPGLEESPELGIFQALWPLANPHLVTVGITEPPTAGGVIMHASTIASRTQRIHDMDGLSIAPHPVSSNWSLDDLAGTYLNAMEIKVEYQGQSHEALWDQVLRRNPKIWGVCTDDAHDPEAIAHGWIRVAHPDVAAKPQWRELIDRIKIGCFFAQRSRDGLQVPSLDVCPEFQFFHVIGSSRPPLRDERISIGVRNASRLIVITGKRRVEIDNPPAEFVFAPTHDDGYVRFQAENDVGLAYSQPFQILYPLIVHHHVPDP